LICQLILQKRNLKVFLDTMPQNPWLQHLDVLAKAQDNALQLLVGHHVNGDDNAPISFLPYHLLRAMERLCDDVWSLVAVHSQLYLLRFAFQVLSHTNHVIKIVLGGKIVYRADEVFLSRMRGLEPNYFNLIKTMYHYGSIYIKHDRRYLQNTAYPLKRFLYYLRGILACRWVEERLSMPPVLFIDLVNGTVKEEDIRQKINELLALKRQSKENDLKEVDPGLVEYARHWADYYTDNIKLFRPELNRPSSEALDSILFDMVRVHIKRER